MYYMKKTQENTCRDAAHKKEKKTYLNYYQIREIQINISIITAIQVQHSVVYKR